MENKKISKQNLYDFLYELSKNAYLIRRTLLLRSEPEEKLRTSISALEIEDMFRKSTKMLGIVDGLQKRIEGLKYPFTDLAPSECSYAEIIHHLEVLNTIYGTGSEIEEVRKIAMKVLWRNEDKKD